MKSVYRGGIGQWSWLLHRLTGVGVLLFLVIHILDTALVMLGPELYNKVISIYRMPLFAVGEILLFAAVLFHALNGLRIVVIDFWPSATLHHKALFKAVLILFFLVYIPVAIIMLGHLFPGAH
jgi:succinate dehydrogenase / fumarate reductase, cytochrome b subunit